MSAIPIDPKNFKVEKPKSLFQRINEIFDLKKVTDDIRKVSPFVDKSLAHLKTAITDPFSRDKKAAPKSTPTVNADESLKAIAHAMDKLSQQKGFADASGKQGISSGGIGNEGTHI